MTLFSEKGQKSTGFERGLFVSVLIIAAAVITPGITETLQTKTLFATADPALLSRCQEKTDYSAWRFWNSKIQAYSTCIVEAKDAKVQNAAGKYLLQGTEGTFTIESAEEAPASQPPRIKAP